MVTQGMIVCVKIYWKSISGTLKKIRLQAWWLKSAILATQEVEVKKI
jgi:hypothetical protein